MDIYELISKDDTLKVCFKCILENNTSNNAPYHHFHHMMSVTKHLFKGISHYPELSNDYHTILIGGMFHDMNHSMGKENDGYNVKQAIKAFEDFYEENPFENVDKGKVINMIKATQYPYVIDDKDLTLEQQLIRDADLMMVLEPDWFQNIVLGLNVEMNVNDPKKVIEGNIEFHKNIKMRTKWGKELYKSEWDNVIKRFENLRDIL
jgi:hypothetical protein